MQLSYFDAKALPWVGRDYPRIGNINPMKRFSKQYWYWTFRVLLYPPIWMRNYPTSDELSEEVNRLLDGGHSLKSEDEYTSKLAYLNLWIASWPHAYGRLYPNDYAFLVNRKTAMRLRSQQSSERKIAQHIKNMREKALMSLITQENG